MVRGSRPSSKSSFFQAGVIVAEAEGVVAAAGINPRRRHRRWRTTWRGWFAHRRSRCARRAPAPMIRPAVDTSTSSLLKSLISRYCHPLQYSAHVSLLVGTERLCPAGKSAARRFLQSPDRMSRVRRRSFRREVRRGDTGSWLRCPRSTFPEVIKSARGGGVGRIDDPAVDLDVRRRDPGHSGAESAIGQPQGGHGVEEEIAFMNWLLPGRRRTR